MSTERKVAREAAAKEKRAAYIARVVAEAPPLTDAQIDHIAVLLRPRPARAAHIESVLADWPAPTPRQERTIGQLLGNTNVEKDEWDV